MNGRTVLISGLGIAGPTLAFWLKAAGFQPTVVERAGAPRAGGYVVDFWGRGYDVVERMGLVGELDRIGYHMREVRIVNERGARVAGFGTKALRELAGGRFITLGRGDLAQLLYERLGGATEVVFGDEIAGLEERPDGVMVRFGHGGERRFDLVVGADGLHSRVRALVFGPQERCETRLGYAVAAFEARGYRPRDDEVYVIFSEPGRMLSRVALRDDRTLFLFVFAAAGDRLPAGTDPHAQKAMLRQRYGDQTWECARILAELDRAGDLYFDRVSQIRMGAWSRGRVALVGDAAFCVSLEAGQGAALAVTAAYVLAGELGKAGARHDEAFRRYEALLRDFIGRKQRGAERVAAAFTPRTRLGLLVRNQLLKTFAIPGMARWTFGRDIVDTLRLPDYRWPALPAMAA